MSDVTFRIKEHICVLSTSEKGWTKELNLVEWGDQPAKYDIRAWSPDHTKMGKGITLDSDELMKIVTAGSNAMVVQRSSAFTSE